MDVIRAAHLAREGLALWGAQKLADAVKCYEEAIAHADPEHWETPLYHQQLASVLAALGRDADALEQFRKTLELEQSQGGDDAGVEVAMARYFLAEHHARMRAPSAGLDALAPSLVVGGKLEALLCTVQAECLWQLGHIDEARAAAQRAMDRARSDIQRGKIGERLAVVLGQDGLPE
jgi:tetratricopeptide (TPR) repeat protein